LSALDISRLHLDQAELAFLSACSTAGGNAQLADEALHIAAAFQLAGYTHVVATLWPIADDLAPLIAHDLYLAVAPISGQRRSRLSNCARALHDALRGLREQRGYWVTPSLWAAYIHAGP
jgi:CHAT domain-containing protein